MSVKARKQLKEKHAFARERALIKAPAFGSPPQTGGNWPSAVGRAGDPGQPDDLAKTERHSTRGRRSAFGEGRKGTYASLSGASPQPPREENP